MKYVKQEAQLLQKDCVTLHVVEYFANSLEIIRNDTLSSACVSPYVSPYEYSIETVCISYRF